MLVLVLCVPLSLSLSFRFVLTESMVFQHCQCQRLPSAMPTHICMVPRSVDMPAQWMSSSWLSQLPGGPFARLILNMRSVDRQPPDAQDAAILRRWRLHVGRSGSPQSTKTQPDIYEGGRWTWFFEEQNCLACIFWLVTLAWERKGTFRNLRDKQKKKSEMTLYYVS